MIHRTWCQNRVFRKVNFGVTDWWLGEAGESHLRQFIDLVLVVGSQQLWSARPVFFTKGFLLAYQTNSPAG